MKNKKNKYLLVSISMLIIMLNSIYGQTNNKSFKKTNTTAKPLITKYGALAIDRNNGFYFGWSYDYKTLAEAETKAIEECKKKGGNCSVVLSFSGTGCAAYRTIDGSVGTAYGWGIAKTKAEADVIATKECLKRSNGKPANNFVWSCNSANSGNLKEIFNASEEINSIPKTVSDIEGNIYKTIKIGTQVWTAENLKVTKYNDGTKISLVTDQLIWDKLTTEGYCWYNNDENTYKNTYGALYNAYTVNTGKLCPTGWHVPNDAEWTTLTTYLGGEEIAGGKMKESGTAKWKTPNKDATNETNFSAIPGGYRLTKSVKYSNIGQLSSWWSSTEVDTYYQNGRFVNYSGCYVVKTNDKKIYGLSVRCIKNN